MFFAVEHDVCVFKPSTNAGGSGAPQLNAHARHQFDHAVGLDHVIVCAGFKTPHPVYFF